MSAAAGLGGRVVRAALGMAAVATALVVLTQNVSSLIKVRIGLGSQLVADWGLLVLFVLGATIGGAGVVQRLTPQGRRDGFWPLAFSSGVVVFGIAVGLFGWMGLLNPVFFFALPLALIGFGWTRAVEAWTADFGAALDPRRFSVAQSLALGLGAVCLFLVAMQTLSPDNVNYDAAWYHLRAAERYALAGGLVRPPEGDQLLTLPQLNSWLYAWAFLHPAAGIEQKVRLSLLIEFATFAGTLALIPPLVRALMPGLPRESTAVSWVALFFFPSIFIYDTGIMGGADHVVAFFATATLLGWFHARQSATWHGWALFGVQLAGLLAKYSSLYLLVPLVPAVLVDVVARKKKLSGPMVAAGVVLALAIPYWARNLIWYHNPVYPLLSGIFPNHPWNEDARAWIANYQESNSFSEAGNFTHRLQSTAAALYNYQTEIYSWADMTGGQPIFGSAYFLSVLALPFVAGHRRLLALALILHVGIAVWFNTHQHHMRYLTVLMAPMAASAAAVAISAWRGWPWHLGKLAVLGAVGYHLVAFADVPFRKTHRMAWGESTVGLATSYVAKGGERSPHLSRWESVGAAMPPNGVALMHGIYPHLGLGRQSVTDVVGLQFGINYGRWGSLKEIHRHLREMGVTHLLWAGAAQQSDSVAGEALFLGFASRCLDRQVVGGFSLAELPESPPEEVGDGVLYLGCGHLFPNGLYALEQLKDPMVPMFHPYPDVKPKVTFEGDWKPLLSKASYVVQEEGCTFEAPPGADFTLLGAQDGFPKKLDHFVRTHGQADPL